MGVNDVVQGGDNLIRKPLAKNNERYVFVHHIERLLPKGKRAAVIVSYEDGTISGVGIRMTDPNAVALLISYAKGGLGDTGRDLYNILMVCRDILAQQPLYTKLIAGVVVILFTEATGEVATGEIGLGKAQAHRAIDAARDGLTAIRPGA